mgnify:CR=1 FL=1
MKIRFLDEAVEELRAAALWYESKQPGLGILLVQRVDEAVARAVAMPLSFPWWTPNREYRRALTHQFPHSVVFRLRDDELQVIAVAHTKRRPGYWRAR